MKCNQTQLKNVCLFIQGQLGITLKGTAIIKTLVESGAGEKVEIIFGSKKGS